MANPFDDPEADYLVLANDEGQHSLWPVFSPVPDGWHQVFGAARRPECVKYVEQNWQDLRPKSLVAHLSGH
ncbi:MbtH family protein [Kitasatospora sp. NPDC059160]|uniref:MbtH family protein n=1 Tax=Kitasatospora sp. NPDC059160 TaxID=3346748 RepID=UPI0036B4C1EA